MRGHRCLLLVLIIAGFVRPADRRVFAQDGRVIHVKPEPKDGRAKPDGPGPVQRALEQARAGDIVRLSSGLYHERVAFKNSGTAERPIILEGPRDAILDGTVQGLQLVWESAADISEGAWRAQVDFRPRVAVSRHAEGPRYLIDLRDDRLKGSWPLSSVLDKGGPNAIDKGHDGWQYVKCLWVYRRSVRDIVIKFEDRYKPEAEEIGLAPDEPVVSISGVDHAVVRGITIRAGLYGVMMTKTRGSRVQDCLIAACRHGVRLDEEAHACKILANEIRIDSLASNDPTRAGNWDVWTAHKNTGNYGTHGVVAVNTGHDNEISYNYIYDTMNGIQPYCFTKEHRWKNPDGRFDRGLMVHHNRLDTINDDALEPSDGGVGQQWYANVVTNSRVACRIKGPTLGPMYFYRNLTGSGIGEHWRAFGDSPAKMYFYHNTVFGGGVAMSWMKHPKDGIGCPNAWFLNNVFVSRRYFYQSGNAPRTPNFHADYNLICVFEPERSASKAKMFGWDMNGLFVREVGLVNPEKGDVRLRRDSPGIDRGVILKEVLGFTPPGADYAGKRPDIGAYEAGRPMPDCEPVPDPWALKIPAWFDVKTKPARKKKKVRSVARRAPVTEEKEKEDAAARGKAAYERLRADIIAGVASGKKATVYVDAAGVPTRARMLKADAEGFTVSLMGKETPIAWADVVPSRFLAIAKKYSKDTKALEEYARANGMQ